MKQSRHLRQDHQHRITYRTRHFPVKESHTSAILLELESVLIVLACCRPAVAARLLLGDWNCAGEADGFTSPLAVRFCPCVGCTGVSNFIDVVEGLRGGVRDGFSRGASRISTDVGTGAGGAPGWLGAGIPDAMCVSDCERDVDPVAEQMEEDVVGVKLEAVASLVSATDDCVRSLEDVWRSGSAASLSLSLWIPISMGIWLRGETAWAMVCCES